MAGVRSSKSRIRISRDSTLVVFPAANRFQPRGKRTDLCSISRQYARHRLLDAIVCRYSKCHGRGASRSSDPARSQALEKGAPMENKPTVDRRNFLGALGVTVGGGSLVGAGLLGGQQVVKAAAEPAKGKIPDTPYKTGHMTFLTGPAAVLGEPSLKGHILAAEEIN